MDSKEKVVPSFEHNKILKELSDLDNAPADSDQFSEWIKAGEHLEFLRRNAASDEIVIFGSGEYSFMHSAVIPRENLESLSQDDLLQWGDSPFDSFASYVWGGGRDDVWLESYSDNTGFWSSIGTTPLIFGRTFEGWTGPERTYYEVNQEYAHVAGIHWRPENRSYCRFDSNGDIKHAVSVSTRADTMDKLVCISFSWQTLEEYLTVSDSVLMRRFDFTLLRRGNFGGWPDGPESIHKDDNQLLFRQKIVPGHAAYTTGIQLVAPRRPRNIIFDSIRGGSGNKEYVDFLVYDWRNGREATVSTDPAASTNYFEARNNSLPFEISPAFFRPEVILKYKMDKDKYTIGERDITCRSAWRLRAFDVNEAGQVFAYVGYLRALPHSEQLHWKSYNEAPKAGISKRALVNDFEGRFVEFVDPLQQILFVLRAWGDEKVDWWKLRDEQLVERVSTPLTASRDEWADAFMDLAKLVVEGFIVSSIRTRLDGIAVAYDKDEKSIKLLERLIGHLQQSSETTRLEALRAVQHIRSKVKGHTNGQEAAKLANGAVSQHGTFTAHFRHVCTNVAEELRTIAEAFA